MTELLLERTANVYGPGVRVLEAPAPPIGADFTKSHAPNHRDADLIIADEQFGAQVMMDNSNLHVAIIDAWRQKKQVAS